MKCRKRVNVVYTVYTMAYCLRLTQDESSKQKKKCTVFFLARFAIWISIHTGINIPIWIGTRRSIKICWIFSNIFRVFYVFFCLHDHNRYTIKKNPQTDSSSRNVLWPENVAGRKKTASNANWAIKKIMQSHWLREEKRNTTSHSARAAIAFRCGSHAITKSNSNNMHTSVKFKFNERKSNCILKMD